MSPPRPLSPASFATQTFYRGMEDTLDGVSRREPGRCVAAHDEFLLDDMMSQSE